MFGAQLYNVGTSWDEITSVLRVMEAGTWTSAYVYDHFVPPLGGRAVETRPNLEGWMLLGGYEGRYYRLTEAPFIPNHYRGAGPRGRKRQDAIPIMVGGKGRKRTLKTLAQYGDIMNVISSPEQFKQECAVLDGHCEAVGRDPAEISRTVHIPLRIMDDEQNAKKVRGDADWKPIGSVQRVIDKCGDFIAAGVEEFCFAGIPQHPAMYQRLNEEVLPAFSRGLL